MSSGGSPNPSSEMTWRNPARSREPGFSMCSRQGSFRVAMLDEVLLEHLLQGIVAVRQPSRRFQAVEAGDQVALDGGVELFAPRGAPLGAKIALVSSLIFEVASAWHGAADKRPIPGAAISKGERRIPPNSEIFRLARRRNRVAR